MQVAFFVLLMGVLTAALISFAILGASQHRRTRALARRAHEMGMRFSGVDLFDVPQRYADFALISSGHSPRADNVTYGRLNGVPFRAFDFRYEVGHGTRRLARHYEVVVIEMARAVPRALMWNRRDLSAAPQEARQGEAVIAGWACRGDGAVLEKLVEALAPLAEAGASLQTAGSVLMVCMPARRRRDYARWLGHAADLSQAVLRWAGEDHARK